MGSYRAQGGYGGKKGSSTIASPDGNPGTSNIGDAGGYCDIPKLNILNTNWGTSRMYLLERTLTSKPGKGGSIISVYSGTSPTTGEDGCAVITFFE